MTATMKKMILLLIALVAVMGIHAQVVVEVYKNEVLQATYFNTTANKYKVRFKKSDGSNEQVAIYKNGAFDESYTNTSDAKYKVIFRELDGGTINGHDYINIGGKKWGTMNVGATTVAESNTTSFGGYYAWGEVDTYYSSIDRSNSKITWKSSTKTHVTGSKTSYNIANYYGGSSSTTFSEWSPAPYNSESKVLTESYDVAHAEWGSTWRMPTTDEFKSLYDACGSGITQTISGDKNHLSAGGVYWLDANTTVDEIEYKVAGMLFVSTTTTSSRVFFPAAGDIVTTNLKSDFGDYWSSSLYEDTNKLYSQSHCFEFKNSEVKSQNNANRYVGHTIRAVSE